MTTLKTMFAGDQLEQELRKFCLKAPADEAIMPERKLANQYGISHGTVRRVLSDLLGEGLIYKVQGKGTFVARQAPSDTPSTVMFADTWENGHHPFFMGRLQGITLAAEAVGVRLEVFHFRAVQASYERLIQDLERQHVKGLIIGWVTEELMERIRATNPDLHIVVTASSCPVLGVSSAGVDYLGVGVGAMDYLNQHGVSRPALVSFEPMSAFGAQTRASEVGLELQVLSVRAETDLAALRQDIQAANADGLAFDDDHIASKLLPLLKLPADFPVVSLDNVGSTLLPPGIARLEMDGQAIGRLILRHLDDRINGHGAPTDLRLRPVLRFPRTDT